MTNSRNAISDLILAAAFLSSSVSSTFLPWQAYYHQNSLLQEIGTKPGLKCWGESSKFSHIFTELFQVQDRHCVI